MIFSPKFFALAASAITSVSASCGHIYTGEVLGSVEVAGFNYTETGGPLNWYGLNSTANNLCAKGKHQSPIVLDKRTGFLEDNSKLVMKVPKTDGGRMENIGDVIQVKTNGTLSFEGLNYTLSQFHFHTPSEHRIEEEYSPMEMHWVYQTPNKDTAVVAFMFELNPYGYNPEVVDNIFHNLGGASEPGNYTKTEELEFDYFIDHLMHNPIYYYTGSLTTPPCTEGIKWLVSQIPLPLNVCTYNAVKRVLKYNARYTQNALGEENLLSLAASELNGH